MDKGVGEKFIIKKDFFIKSRKEDIRLFYEFSPKVTILSSRYSEEEHTESSTKLNLNNLPTLIESSNSLLKKWSKIHKVLKTRYKF